MKEIEKYFDKKYTEPEKDVFTWALTRDNQIKKTRLNKDTTVYTVKVKSLNSYCVIFDSLETVFFRNFNSIDKADNLHELVVKSYGT
jgi:hypothetical protein